MERIKFFNKEILTELKFEEYRIRGNRILPNLIPVILQNYETNAVLFGASMTMETLEETMETGYVALYSKSRRAYWRKGETSGNTLKVKEVYVNCENNQLLFNVILQGEGACHERDENGKFKPTCFSKPLLIQ